MESGFFDRFCIQRAISKLKEPIRDEACESIDVEADKEDWFLFLGSFTAIFGSMLFASGVIFFIAANWESIGKFFKFFIIDLFIVGAVLVSYLSKNALTSKVALSVAFILLGGLLALIGQIYQTGANSWELFFYWAILGLAWVVVGRFEPLWILWVVVVNTSATLYLHLRYSYFGLYISDYSIIIFINLALLAIFELLYRLDIYKFKFLIRFLATIVVVTMTISMINTIFSTREHLNIYPVIFGVLLYFYLRRDNYIIAILALSFDVVILALFGKWVSSIRGIEIVGVLMVMSIVSISLAIFTINLIKGMTKGVSDDL